MLNNEERYMRIMLALYTLELHEALLNGKVLNKTLSGDFINSGIDNKDESEKQSDSSKEVLVKPKTERSVESFDTSNNDGTYIVMLRVLKRNGNVIIYQTLHYNDIFTRPLLLFLVSKTDFKISTLFKEFGDFFTLICENVGDTEFLNMIKSEQSNLSLYLQEYINTYGYPTKFENYTEFLDIVKKNTYINTTETVIDIADKFINKQYDKVFGTDNVIEVNNSDNIYFIKDCVFVTGDLKLFIKKLSSLGYEINKGPKSYRDQLNSMSQFLALFDQDFRQWLYYVQLSKARVGHIPNTSLLPRSKFAFKNVHMNIGNIKFYSTTTRSVKTNRQDLYDENSNIIKDILHSNHHLGLVEVQRKIETFLFEQESIYSDVNKIAKRLSYNNVDFIVRKIHLLRKLLKGLEEPSKLSNYDDIKYIPISKIIIKELGDKFIAELLMSYFIEILNKQLLSNYTKQLEIEIEIEDDDDDFNNYSNTSGSSTLQCYRTFGRKLWVKYLNKIYMDYINSNPSEIKPTFSEYVDMIKNDYSIMYDDKDSYTYLGSNFVINLINADLLKEKLIRDEDDNIKTIANLVVNSYASKLLVKENMQILHLPEKLPMVCEPKDYVQSSEGKIVKLGGYLLNDVKYSNPPIRNKMGHKKDSTLEPENLIVDLVNGMSKVPYKINREVLDFVYEYGIEKEILVESREEIRSYLDDNKETNKTKQFKSLVSQYLHQKNVLSIAEVYSNVEKLYFPISLDFRGRIYCNTDYFGYQSDDLSKGLISFANPGYLTKLDHDAIKYFKGYGANMFGNSLNKKSLNYRCKWVDDNSDYILNFEYNDIISKAENKVCFLSFCFEYKRFISFLNSKEEMILKTYLPIRLDASCNGYQHLSLLTKEVKLFNLLNLGESTFDDDPCDFYSHISDLLEKYMDNQIKELKIDNSKEGIANNKQVESFKRLRQINFSRSILKKIIMKQSYNASIVTLVEDVTLDNDIQCYDRSTGELIEIKKGNKRRCYYIYKDKDVKLTRGDISKYVMAIKTIAEREAPKITKLSKYLDNIAEICTLLGIEVPWTLPSGLKIFQSYLKTEQKSISAFSFSKSRYKFIKFIDTEYKLKKQKSALRPNLIHSLDASVIAILYKNFNKSNIYTVHDCFAVTADNVPNLINRLKNIYMKLYSEKGYLFTFDFTLKVNICSTFGDEVYKMNDKYIHILNRKTGKYKTYEYPNIDSIITCEDIGIIKKSSYIGI